MSPSPAFEERVRERAAKLDELAPDLRACRVAIELPHRHHHKGRTFRIRVELSLAGKEIVVGRNPTEHLEHERIDIALRDAFDAARRQLGEYVRIRRRRASPIGLAKVPEYA